MMLVLALVEAIRVVMTEAWGRFQWSRWRFGCNWRVEARTAASAAAVKF